MAKYSEDIQVEQPAIDLFDQPGKNRDFEQQIVSPLLWRKGEEIASEITKRMHGEFDNYKGHEV